MSKCNLVQTFHIIEKTTGMRFNLGNDRWLDEETLFDLEINCPLHAFLVANDFKYVPCGFTVFTSKMKLASVRRVTMFAQPKAVIRVVPNGYKPCLKSSLHYPGLKAMQPSPHITIGNIVFDQWKLNRRKEILDYTIDMVDGGVYNPEGVLISECANLFMLEHFTVKI